VCNRAGLRLSAERKHYRNKFESNETRTHLILKPFPATELLCATLKMLQIQMCTRTPVSDDGMNGVTNESSRRPFSESQVGMRVNSISSDVTENVDK
jgi:hypothetical protein